MSLKTRMEGAGGKSHSFWAMYSLRMSFWLVPASSSGRDALLLGGHDVHREQHHRGGVYGHGGRDLAHRDALEEPLHVLQGVYRDALGADLAEGQAASRESRPIRVGISKATERPFWP